MHIKKVFCESVELAEACLITPISLSPGMKEIAKSPAGSKPQIYARTEIQITESPI